AGARAFPDPQAGIQDHRLAGLRSAGSAPRDRFAVRRDEGADRQLREEGRGLRACLHVRARARRGAATARANHGKSRRLVPRIVRETLISVRDLVIAWGPFFVIGVALLVVAYWFLDPTPPKK